MSSIMSRRARSRCWLEPLVLTGLLLLLLCPGEPARHHHSEAYVADTSAMAPVRHEVSAATDENELGELHATSVALHGGARRARAIPPTPDRRPEPSARSQPPRSPPAQSS